MLPYAQGTETYKEYIGSLTDLVIVLSTLLAVVVFMFFFMWFFSCYRGCCSSCKKDFSRTDYKKHQKIKPGLWFVAFNLIGFALVAYLLYQFLNMWYFFAFTYCKASDFVATLEANGAASIEQYKAALDRLDGIYEPVLYSNFAAMLLLLLCFMLSLVVILCVMITKKRAYKNVSHIAWVSGMSTVLVATMIGCGTTFGGLEVFDACQVTAWANDQQSVTGLNTFYPVGIQPLINECVYPPPVVEAEPPAELYRRHARLER